MIKLLSMLARDLSRLVFEGLVVSGLAQSPELFVAYLEQPTMIGRPDLHWYQDHLTKV
jgi:hypothetical protein